MIVPFQADVPMKRWPIANFVLIGLIILISISAIAGAERIRIDHSMVLNGWSPSGMVGHMFLHADIVHLLGNMVFLWVFGNAICAKFGNGFYVILFLVLGILAAMTHNIMDGAPAVGASGAINGVVGAFFIFYPINTITCFYFFFFRGGTFTLSSMYMILLWLAFDIWGASSGEGNVAYWAHIGGFIAGAGLAILALKLSLVKVEHYERSIFDVIGKN